MRIGRRPRVTPEQVLGSRPMRNPNLTTEELPDGGLRIVGQRSDRLPIRLLSMLFPIPKERRIELDSVGRQVWELCDGEHTLREMIELFRKRHKLTHTEAEWSLRNYLRDLGKRGLVGFVVDESKSGRVEESADDRSRTPRPR